MDLIIKNVSKVIGSSLILRDININVKSGEVVGLVGLNGSGKSTLFKILLGFYSYNGEILINGVSDVNEVIKKIGFMIESPSLFDDMSARENLKYWASFYDNVNDERIDEVLKLVGLHNVDKKVKNFSLGMKQRLGIGISILHSPNLLILDEPTNALDLKAVMKIRNIIKNMEGTTVIIASHDVNELSKICDKLVLIKNGSVIDEIMVKSGVNLEGIVIEKLGGLK